MSYHLPVIIFLIPFLTAVCMPVVGGKNRDWCRPMALAAVFAMCVTAVVNLWVVLDHGETRYAFGGWPVSTSLLAPPIGIEWVNDTLASVMLVALSFLASVCLIYGGPVLPQSLGRQVVLYYTLILILISGLTGIVFAGDIFNIFVFLEVAALSAYALVAVPGGRALVAAFRYLILGTLGASFYLLGVVFFYAATGTLNMADLASRLPALWDARPVRAAFAFIVVGAGLKFALFPLHWWLPNAYTHAPSVVSAFLAGTATKVGILILLRFVFGVFGVAFAFGVMPLGEILTALSLIAILFGSLAAIFQDNLKRMLAYSSIAQIGYIVLGIGIGNLNGLVASLVHLFNHAAMKGALFLALAAVFYRVGAVDMASIRGLGRRMPYTMAAFVVASASLVGLPLTVGFISKWYLLLAALETGQWSIVAVIVFSSLLALIYTLRVIEAAYFQPSPDDAGEIVEAPLAMLAPLMVLAFACLYFGIDTGLTVGVAKVAALSLLGGYL